MTNKELEARMASLEKEIAVKEDITKHRLSGTRLSVTINF